MEGRWLDPEKIILSIIQESLIILWKAELKQKRIWILLGSKHFSVQMYAVLIEDQSMMQWEVSEHKTIFNEDMIMASKMIENGKAVAYQADARVWHWHDYKAIQQLHRNFDLAVSQVDHGGLFLKVRSESEGVKWLSQRSSIFQKGKLYLIPKYVIDTGFKLIGYKLGRNYKTAKMDGFKAYDESGLIESVTKT